MEEFREKIKLDNLTLAVCAFLLAAFSILITCAEAGLVPFPTPTAGDSHWQSMWRGFITGAACAMLFFMLFGLVRNIRALKDEKALKKLYIKSHDERAIQIWGSARAAAYQTFLILGIVAAVIAGYFSMTVSITIIACIWVASILGLLFKVYFCRKF